MTIKNFLYYFLLMVALIACKQNEPLLESKDQDLLIQAIRLKSSSDEDTYSYQARLIPDKHLLESKSSQEKKALFYQMDSCFYISDGNNKVPAVLVQPIANGISGCYEYLVQFQITKEIKDVPLFIIYQDRYINKKRYNLKAIRN